MISTSQSKLIRSLQKKKFRDQHRLFLVEGEKMVGELASGDTENRFQIQELFANPEWIQSHLTSLQQRDIKVTEASPSEIKKVSNLVTPQPVMALVSKPEESFLSDELLNTPVLAFESIRDPGNLGTIIRTADWFGIRHLVCTPDSTDLYNPKVVQSTMGAITRVRVHYLNIEDLLKREEMQQKTVFGTFMEGENIYETSLEPDPLILFGNESHGLSKHLNPHIHRRISIPPFSPLGSGSESLNVASSVAVVCSELRRR
ncbi:MAG: RNA methyltransferase [Bacteroidota bacterium]|nr:RNA methyltransferase [Bacteroidota bacterium]